MKFMAAAGKRCYTKVYNAVRREISKGMSVLRMKDAGIAGMDRARWF